VFWTAFVWGVGVTLGGAIGVMAFIVLYAVWDALWQKLMKTKAGRCARELSELTLAAVEQRNELTREQILMLERVAQAIETVADKD